MRFLAHLGILVTIGCGPNPLRPGGVSFLELARLQRAPTSSRAQGVVHFRGETVAEAEVTAVRFDGRRVALLTDHLGRFALDAPTSDVLMVIARAGELLGVVDQPGQDSLDVELLVPWKVGGTVRDASGAPVAGARVTGSWQQSTCTGPYGGVPIFETSTDASGAYVATLASPYNWLSASVSDGRQVFATADLYGAPESSRLDLVLPADSSKSAGLSPTLDQTPRDDSRQEQGNSTRIQIALRTLTEGGSGVDGVHTHIDGRRVSGSDRLVVDYDWNPEWADLYRQLSPDGNPSVFIERRGYESASVSFTPDRPAVFLGDVILRPGQGLTVKVTDPQGVPITGCSLLASGKNLMTDASGTAWTSVGAGEVQLTPLRCCVGNDAVYVPYGVEAVSVRFERDEESCARPPNG